jgi:pyruvate dehydrogenase complex dihydrolipoamide acetyltransferase long form
MSTKITMPRLGESVSEGTIGRWLKQVGDTVKKDESIVEIVTDKVTAEYPSPVTGKVVKILVGEDATVPVGTEIAEIEEAGGTGSGGGSAGASASVSGGMLAPGSSSAGPMASATHAPTSGNGGSPTPPTATMYNGAAMTGAGARAPQAAAVAERISPLARRLAQEHGIDLQQVRGTGENGRIRKEDIEAHLAQRSQTRPAQPAAIATAPVTSAAPAMPAAPASAPPIAPTAPITYTAEDQLVTPSPARRAIAEHMVRSLRTSPHAWTSVEVDMTNIARWLDRNKDEFKRREGYGISFQTFAIKATAEALREHPYLNASWTEEGKILLRKQVNIGVSIALENNLVVPVIRNADMLNLAGIARAVNDLVSRARSNKLMPADVQGATFTVNNPGVFGTVLSMAIINQPNAGILTMDAVVKRPVVVAGDAIAVRSMMFVSLSFDHRVIDGLQAARFLGAVKGRLEGWSAEASAY